MLSDQRRCFGSPLQLRGENVCEDYVGIAEEGAQPCSLLDAMICEEGVKASGTGRGELAFVGFPNALWTLVQ